MYYHPMTWTRSPERAGGGYWEGLFDLLAEGTLGQQRLHMEAMKAVFLAPLWHAHALSEAQGAAAFAARCFEAPLRSYAKLAALWRRASELAAETSRSLHERIGAAPGGPSVRERNR